MTRATPHPSSSAMHCLAGSGLLAVVLACGVGITLLCIDLLHHVGQPIVLSLLQSASE